MSKAAFGMNNFLSNGILSHQKSRFDVSNTRQNLKVELKNIVSSKSFKHKVPTKRDYQVISVNL